MYTVEEIKKMRKYDEDEYDEDHKQYAEEVKKAKVEKRLFFLTLFLFIFTWFTYLNQKSEALFDGEDLGV